MYDFLLVDDYKYGITIIIFEIKRDIGRKSRFFIPLHSTPRLVGRRDITVLVWENENSMAI